jgi:hypothetical protein
MDCRKSRRKLIVACPKHGGDVEVDVRVFAPSNRYLYDAESQRRPIELLSDAPGQNCLTGWERFFVDTGTWIVVQALAVGAAVALIAGSMRIPHDNWNLVAELGMKTIMLPFVIYYPPIIAVAELSPLRPGSHNQIETMAWGAALGVVLYASFLALIQARIRARRLWRRPGSE